MRRVALAAGIALLLGAGSTLGACGVKRPPRPPVAVTPSTTSTTL